VLAFLLFGRPGRIATLMKDLGEGIRGFRKGLSESETPPPSQEPPAQVQDQSAQRETDRAPH
jgi:TatA/E family protein of Tat protein translocase